MSHAWETPVIWLASMCCCIFLYGACFPQTLQEAIFPWAAGRDTSLLVIIDIIFSSRSCSSTLILSFLTATVVSEDIFEDWSSKGNQTWSVRKMSRKCFANGFWKWMKHDSNKSLNIAKIGKYQRPFGKRHKPYQSTAVKTLFKEQSLFKNKKKVRSFIWGSTK